MQPHKDKAPRILFATGPGDVVKGYEDWRDGKRPSKSTSLTYSSNTFEYCLEANAQAYVISSNANARLIQIGPFTVENRPKPGKSSGAISYHWQQLRYFFSLLRTALAFRAKHLVIDSGTTHWFLFFVCAWMGIKVYPSFHNTYYPRGHWRPSPVRDAIKWLDTQFFRHGVTKAFGVSTVCGEQFVELGGEWRRFEPYFPLFVREFFQDVPVPDVAAFPKRIVFAGRLEADKGIFVLLDAFEQLIKEGLDAVLDVCGDGGVMDALRQKVQSKGLTSRVVLHGALGRSQLLAVYSQSHIVTMPTTSGFTEGLGQVAVEAVLCGRPVVVTDVVPSGDELTKAAVIVPSDDVSALFNALRQLIIDKASYLSKQGHGDMYGQVFFDPQRGLQAALRRGLLL